MFISEDYRELLFQISLLCHHSHLLSRGTSISAFCQLAFTVLDLGCDCFECLEWLKTVVILFFRFVWRERWVVDANWRLPLHTCRAIRIGWNIYDSRLLTWLHGNLALYLPTDAFTDPWFELTILSRYTLPWRVNGIVRNGYYSRHVQIFRVHYLIWMAFCTEVRKRWTHDSREQPRWSLVDDLDLSVENQVLVLAKTLFHKVGVGLVTFELLAFRICSEMCKLTAFVSICCHALFLIRAVFLIGRLNNVFHWSKVI